jgi:hypothetical protein
VSISTQQKARNANLEIIFPNAGKVRARTVVSRSRSRPTGKYPSWKMGRMLEWESHNELNAFRLLDADPDTGAFQEQPLTIRYTLHDDVHIHFPDVLVDRACRRELWEIKPRAYASDPKFLARTRLLENALPALGYSYRLVLAEDLARQPRLSNVLQLLKYGREDVDQATREHVRQILLSVPSISWASAVNGDLGRLGRAVLCRLVLEGVLSYDAEQPLAPTTRFSSRAHQRGDSV